MQRIPEPELMDDVVQAAAYAQADFEDAHARFIELFRAAFPDEAPTGNVLDLGCGPADITVRFARAFPHCVIHGVDGAAAMLDHGRQRIEREQLAQRIVLVHGHLPGAALPLASYDAVISNSLLHHLHDPAVLWRTLARYARPGAPLFVMDLKRPVSRAAAEALVQQYADGEPAILRHDFLHSLCAAYRPDEVAAQLRAAGLDYLAVAEVSDRHLVVHGRRRAA